MVEEAGDYDAQMHPLSSWHPIQQTRGGAKLALAPEQMPILLPHKYLKNKDSAMKVLYCWGI